VTEVDEKTINICSLKRFMVRARLFFYISYVGAVFKINSDKNPSIFGERVLEYIGQSCVFEAIMR